jgi:hypothetical protein
MAYGQNAHNRLGRKGRAGKSSLHVCPELSILRKMFGQSERKNELF